MVLWDGNPVLHNNCPSQSRLGYQDGHERRLPSYYGTPQYQEIFPFCIKFGNLPIHNAPFWHIYYDRITRVHSPEQASTQAQQTKELVQSLGWTIKWQKSLLALSQEIETTRSWDSGPKSTHERFGGWGEGGAVPFPSC